MLPSSGSVQSLASSQSDSTSFTKVSMDSLVFKYQLACVYDAWFFAGELSKKEKALSLWNALLGTSFDLEAKEKIKKLSEGSDVKGE